jgi:hypothetical protein
MVKRMGAPSCGSVQVNALWLARGITYSVPAAMRAFSTSSMADICPAGSLGCVPPNTSMLSPGSSPLRIYTSVSPAVPFSAGNQSDSRRCLGDAGAGVDGLRLVHGQKLLRQQHAQNGGHSKEGDGPYPVML